ncbi:MAG TPA: CHAP domain-containing protein, partial [Ktedonobacterales bacterium]|nr:CHAP domain-containing protein [Ktedonobacterales bacterium]
MRFSPRPADRESLPLSTDEPKTPAADALAAPNVNQPVLDDAAASARAHRAAERLALVQQRRRRALLVTVGVAVVLMVNVMTASGSISTVYAREIAPAVAQDGGLPPPPTDASGNVLPATGTTVPQSVSALDTIQANQTSQTTPPSLADVNCSTVYHSSDGNPYPICPGPQPIRGGNCTWWAWEQWHRLGFNLPGWGDATYWAAAAESYGLQVGTVPRVNALVVFPRGDGVWAFSSAGHVAFVTRVYSDLDTFDVTYENYGDPTLVHYGNYYRASVIQQPRYQNGELRFIYFPGTGGSPGGTGTAST